MVELATALMVIQTVSLTVGVIYYIITLQNSNKNQELSIKNQELTLKSQELTRKAQEQALETRQAQLFMQIFNQWNEKEFGEAYLILREAEFTNFDEFEKIFDTPKKKAQIYQVGTLIEGVGSLLHKGMIDPVLVSDMFYSTAIDYWYKMKPLYLQWRKSGYPRWGEYVEYLALEMEKLGEQIRPELN